MSADADGVPGKPPFRLLADPVRPLDPQPGRLLVEAGPFDRRAVCIDPGRAPLHATIPPLNRFGDGLVVGSSRRRQPHRLQLAAARMQEEHQVAPVHRVILAAPWILGCVSDARGSFPR